MDHVTVPKLARNSARFREVVSILAKHGPAYNRAAVSSLPVIR